VAGWAWLGQKADVVGELGWKANAGRNQGRKRKFNRNCFFVDFEKYLKLNMVILVAEIIGKIFQNSQKIVKNLRMQGKFWSTRI
jgi:hypothetical protein